jgi:putative aldouronate transport system permease protein
LFYNIIFIVTGTAFAVLIAILFNELKGKYLVGFYKTVIILPFFLSWIIVEYIVYGFLNPDKGLLNQILVSLGYHSISWYSNTLFWRIMFPILNLWKGVGYTSVVYLAAISGISPDYYEAAEMDGATKVQKAFRITIPMISPIIITMILLSAGRIFYADLGLFYYVPMNSGMLFPSTNVIDTYVYRALMGATNSFAMSTAVGLYQSLVGLILVLLSNKLVKKYYPDSSLF